MLGRLRNPGLLIGAAVLVGAVGCGLFEDTIHPPIQLPGGGASAVTGSTGGGATVTTTGAGGASGGDLPCDVVAVLAAECDSCHAANIPPLLRNHAEFMAISSDPNNNMAEESLVRMEANTMPPSGTTPASIQVFTDWIAAGAPVGDCGGGTGGGGGGGPDPFAEPPTCSSNQTWDMGSNGGDLMYPGRACNDCHAAMKPDEIYDFAGTVYLTGHEPDDCIGSSGIEVEFTDDNGMVTTTTTNASGNFNINGIFAYPVQVKLIFGGKTLPMVAPLTAADGDCNTCHDQDGNNSAPGRLVIPF